jgi:hypothetical protein
MNAQFKEQADAAFKPLTELEERAKVYSNSIITKPLSDGFKKVALHVYTDNSGVPIYWKIRLKNPDTGDKWIRSFSLDGAGQFQFKEPDFKSIYAAGEGKKPVYRLHEILAAPLDVTVWIVEGEQKADALVKRGLLATTSGGKGSANTTDFTPLAGRCVRIWRDNDAAGIEYQDAVKTALNAIWCNVSIVDVDTLGLPVKGDVVDWLAGREAQGLATTADDVLSLPLVEYVIIQPSMKDGEKIQTQTVDGDEPIDDEAEIQRLATLSIIDYERVRVDEAKRLGLRPAILDKLVKQARDTDEQEVSGSSLFSDVEVWDDPVNIADVLDEIAMIIERHIVCERQTVIAASLWVVSTWTIDSSMIAPIACITAPEKGCGKSMLFDLLGEMVRRPLAAASITAASLFRSIEKWQPTILLDEADTFLKDNEDLRGVINAGHKRKNAFVIRTVGESHEPTRFNVYCAKLISGIGHLSDTLKDRSILLVMRRKRPNENRVRVRHADPQQFERINRKLARWSEDYSEALRIARPELPSALKDRAQDNWESLLSIADLAGESWAKTARHAAMAISGIEEDAPSISEELLIDIKQVFERLRMTRIFSMQLLEELHADEEAAWCTWSHGKPMTARQLSKRLEAFDIKPIQIWAHGKNQRGYNLDQFNDAFERYLAKPSNSSARPLEPNDSKALNDILSARSQSNLADKKDLKPNDSNASSGLADRKPSDRPLAANDNYQTRELGEI